MRRTPAEDIVEFLSLSGSRDHLRELPNADQREAKRLLRWLDDSGLPFYFLQKVKDADAADLLPSGVLSHLEGNFAANQRRMAYMTHRFDFLNHRFHDAGVRYAVLKGFSLVPQFCPQAALRHQSDFDYLVDDKSLPAAQRVLVDAGYYPKPSISDQEFLFLAPGMGEPSHSAKRYYAPEPHAVELHLDIWDSDLNRLPTVGKLFSVERARMHDWNGLEFPVLTDEDAFLVQVLHTFRHLFTYWIRTSCLLEIGYFLNCRATDAALWGKIDKRVGDSLVLREFVVIVADLVANLFAVPIPPLVRVWGQRIRPATRVWIDNYARHCAFADLPVYQFSLFPPSKLILLLLRQYEDVSAKKHSALRQLLVPSRLARIAASVRNNPSLVLNGGWWKRQLLVRRSVFYVLAGLRYLCEIPRWLWLTRAKVRSATLDA